MSMELKILIKRNRPGSHGKAIAEIPDLKCGLSMYIYALKMRK